MGFIKRGYVLVMILFLLVPQIFAANISFLVIETGIREGNPVNESSNLWETILLDVFFDAGHIVSNAPIMRLPNPQGKEIPDEARENLEDAVRGGADFFVVALLDYQGAAAVNSPKIKPQGVSLRLFSMNPYKFLYEQSYSAPTQSPENDELADAKRIVRMIIPHLGDR
ncbi:hypothetical protein LQZ21_00560 [Treponema sp. TIM-1]|uniref:hypothetical protein n=1 Tax=Treponema sp. TIM-1 TaxID=2898417 RepID=UPI0039805C16